MKAPFFMGVDSATHGGDKTVVCLRTPTRNGFDVRLLELSAAELEAGAAQGPGRAAPQSVSRAMAWEMMKHYFKKDDTMNNETLDVLEAALRTAAKDAATARAQVQTNAVGMYAAMNAEAEAHRKHAALYQQMSQELAKLAHPSRTHVGGRLPPMMPGATYCTENAPDTNEFQARAESLPKPVQPALHNYGAVTPAPALAPWTDDL
jgi:hypothetical protein